MLTEWHVAWPAAVLITLALGALLGWLPRPADHPPGAAAVHRHACAGCSCIAAWRGSSPTTRRKALVTRSGSRPCSGWRPAACSTCRRRSSLLAVVARRDVGGPAPIRVRPAPVRHRPQRGRRAVLGGQRAQRHRGRLRDPRRADRACRRSSSRSTRTRSRRRRTATSSSSTASPRPCSAAAACAAAKDRSSASCSARRCCRCCRISSTCSAFRARSTSR